MRSGSAKVLFIDHHTLVRESMSRRLESAGEVCARVAACGADDSAEHAEQLDPDVILADLDIDADRTIAAVARLSGAMPDTGLLFLASAHNQRYIEKVVPLGARGFVIKPVSWDDLTQAIANVADGELFFSASLYARLMLTPSGVQLHQGTRHDALTERQNEVLRMIANGMTKRQIAEHLDISEKTIEGHTDKIMAKLRIHDRVGLTRYAIRAGIVLP